MNCSSWCLFRSMHFKTAGATMILSVYHTCIILNQILNQTILIVYTTVLKNEFICHMATIWNSITYYTNTIKNSVLCKTHPQNIFKLYLAVCYNKLDFILFSILFSILSHSYRRLHKINTHIEYNIHSHT